jgi:hypothetical protein
MKKETLQAIKNTLNKLIPIISAYREANGAISHLLVSVQVTIQNMCFNSSTHEEDVEKFQKHYNFLKELKDSSFTYHFIDFILDEVEMCIEGNMLSEYYDDVDESLDDLFQDMLDEEMDNYEDERVYDEKEPITSLQKYRVYHPANSELNTFCQLDIRFKEVANVYANSLDDAFKKAQNDFSLEYEALGIRSTCVGDVIETNGAYRMIMPTGFQRMYDINII